MVYFKMKTTKALVAYDIEKAGALIDKHPVVSVGFFVGDLKGNELETFRINFRVQWPVSKENGLDYRDFEPECWDSFWSKLDNNIKDQCLVDVHDFKTGWTKVKKWLVDLESKYESIDFLTDNPSFDTACVDYALEKYCNSKPMRYSSTNKYRDVIDVDSMFLMVIPHKKKNYIKQSVREKVIIDHNPVNDAHHIYLMYIKTLECKVDTEETFHESVKLFSYY